MKRFLLPLVVVLLLLGIALPGCNGSESSNNSGNSYVPPPPPPPKPAEFVINSLSTLPIEHIACSPITVDLKMQNTGEVSGDYTAKLRIDGKDAETKKVTLAGGASETVSFEITIDKQGSYTLSVEDITEVIDVLPIPLSTAVIEQSDLPNGFSTYPQTELDIMGNELADSFTYLSGDLSDIHGYHRVVSETDFEWFVAFHWHPLSLGDKVTFNLEANNPEALVKDFELGLEATGIKVKTVKIEPAFCDIGDASYGSTVTCWFNGLYIDMDVVMVRNGDVLTIIYAYRPQGADPVVTTQSVALTISERLSAALATY